MLGPGRDKQGSSKSVDKQGSSRPGGQQNNCNPESVQNSFKPMGGQSCILLPSVMKEEGVCKMAFLEDSHCSTF